MRKTFQLLSSLLLYGLYAQGYANTFIQPFGKLDFVFHIVTSSPEKYCTIRNFVDPTIDYALVPTALDNNHTDNKFILTQYRPVALEHSNIYLTCPTPYEMQSLASLTVQPAPKMTVITIISELANNGEGEVVSSLNEPQASLPEVEIKKGGYDRLSVLYQALGPSLAGGFTIFINQ